MENAETDFLTLRELFTILMNGKKVIFTTVSLFILGAVLFLIFTTHKYVADVYIGPNENALSQYTPKSSFGSLAGAAGLFGGNEGGDFSKISDLITSELVARQLLKDSEIVEVYFPEIWDEKAGRWLPAKGIIATMKGAVAEIFGRPAWTPPDEKALSEILKKDFSSSSVGETQMKKISYAHKNPRIAKNILMKSLHIADSIIKQGNLLQIKNNINYLENRLPTIPLVEVRNQLTIQLAEEEKKKMVLESDLPYAYSQLDSIFVDSSPSRPSIFGVITLGFISGILFGAISIYIKRFNFL